MQAILPEFVDYPQHLHALLNFDGVNDYITVSDNNSLDATSDVTVSAWIKADDWNGQGGVNYSTIVKKDKNYILRADSDGSFGGAGDQLKMYWWDGSNITATAVPLPSTRAWHHIVGVVANNAVSGVYIDGILQSGTSGTAADARDLTVNLSIGNHQTGSNETFHGTIDEVKIYNYALSYDEIKLEYNQGKSVVLGSLSTNPDGITASNSAARAYCPPGDTATCSPPVGHWTLDERTGTSAFDTTGNANTGTLTNGPQWIPGKLGQALKFDAINKYVDAGSDKPGQYIVYAGGELRRLAESLHRLD
jgi:hypothetical protein